ncbi:hypothetical protein U9M49_13570 [Cytobacillus sp. OWB-43]|uniref:hypothetical protein n=1 Tax=Cytobacillus sp. OWB-43 TaxID=3108468 RepID=UPI002B00098A|nr:hypothetical protein [Cytobacillus sp. OWB-43]MEA1854135.1 hypothetical protein [Cytobacillus sp. OWB-43]
MSAANFFRVFNAIILWGTMFFIPGKSIKRFLPVTLFCSCILLIETLFSFVFKWWRVKGGKKYMLYDSIAFILGPLFTINIWVFHLTYGKFFRYVGLNLIIDLLFAYPFNAFFQKIGHYKLYKFTSFSLFISAFAYALINYGFQVLYERYPKEYIKVDKVSKTEPTVK